MKLKKIKLDDSQTIVGLVEGAVVILLQAQKNMEGMSKRKQKQLQQMIEESLIEFVNPMFAEVKE